MYYYTPGLRPKLRREKNTTRYIDQNRVTRSHVSLQHVADVYFIVEIQSGGVFQPWTHVTDGELANCRGLLSHRWHTNDKNDAICCRAAKQTHNNPQLILIHIHQVFRIQYTWFELETLIIDRWICIKVCLVSKRLTKRSHERSCEHCLRDVACCFSFGWESNQSQTVMKSHIWFSIVQPLPWYFPGQMCFN